MARPEPGAVPRRPHHISSIAHLFLEEEGVRDPSPVVHDIAVAAPGFSPVSAFAAAGLVLGSHQPATLSEDNRIRWSAGTFLAREKVRDRVDVDRKESHRSSWTISPGCVVATPDEGEFNSGSTVARGISWNHLGCLGPDGMAHMESLSVGRSLMDLSLDGSGGLVWCLLDKEADLLGPSYILGRLVEIIRPDRIWILLFPDAWTDAGKPGWLENIARNELSTADPVDLVRCAELVGRACEMVRFEIHRVRGLDNLAGSFNGNGERESIWHQMARAVVTDSS